MILVSATKFSGDTSLLAPVVYKNLMDSHKRVKPSSITPLKTHRNEVTAL